MTEFAKFVEDVIARMKKAGNPLGFLGNVLARIAANGGDPGRLVEALRLAALLG